MSEITTLLAAARVGDADAAGRAFTLLYDDLRRLAQFGKCAAALGRRTGLTPVQPAPFRADLTMVGRISGAIAYYPVTGQCSRSAISPASPVSQSSA